MFRKTILILSCLLLVAVPAAAKWKFNPQTGAQDYYEKWTWKGAWALSTAYVADDVVQNSNKAYICILAHTSAAGDEPGVGGSWSTYWGLMFDLSSTGEANTASNQGAGGVGVYYQKVSDDLQFNNINAGSTKITVTADAVNHEVDIDLAEAQVTVENLKTAGASGTAPISDGATGLTMTDVVTQTEGDTAYESHTSNDIDPDRLAGDTVDDNLIDNALLDTDLQTFAGITPSANVQSLLGTADYAAMKTLLGYYTATSDLDADLQTFAGITPSANVQTFLGAADYAAMKTQLAIVQADISDLAHTDTNAWHVATSNELSVVTEKASPVVGDWVLIEDSESSGAKKKVQIGNMPAGGPGTDSSAIHDNVSGEIHAITEKATPVNADVLIIEDSASSYAKKWVQVGNLPGSTDDQTATEVATSVTNFDGILSASETTVQAALDILDDITYTDVGAEPAGVIEADISDLGTATVLRSDYNANTILAATSDNVPAALTISEQTLVGRITSGNIAALSTTQVRTLINVEDGADVTDATNVNAAGAVMEADYDAYTMLYADTDNTPAALSVGASTFVGRKASGGISAMSVTESKALLSVDDLVTLSGVADGAVNLGTFTGTTIADNQTIKQALQALETFGEANAVSDTAWNATSWDAVTTIAPSKNAVRDKLVTTGASTDIGITNGASYPNFSNSASDDSINELFAAINTNWPTGATTEIQDETYSAANFDNDTTHGPSQDDFYDLMHTMDTDDDGLPNKVDLATAGFVLTSAAGVLATANLAEDADGVLATTAGIALNNATGNEVAFTINYTTNKATSGNDTGLVINKTDTSSPGTSLLVDLQVGGTSMFSVDDEGNIPFAAFTEGIPWNDGDETGSFVYSFNFTDARTITLDYDGDQHWGALDDTAGNNDTTKYWSADKVYDQLALKLTTATYDANTILYATSDDTPVTLVVAEQTLVGRITSGEIDALTATEVRTLINVEDGADVTDATNVDTAGAVMEADFNAYTVLYADTDNTPAALTVGASTFVGRKASGGIAALSKAEAQAELSVDDLVTLSGVADGSTHLGTFTGDTITDNQTIKAALQLLETAVEAAGGHAAVTLDANADALLSISTQELGLDTQTANYVFAGPVSGGAVVPTFRALVAADVMSITASISGLTEKATPTTSDWLVIDDAAASSAKKKVAMSLDKIPNGSSFEKVAAADVNSSGHIDRLYDTNGSHYAQLPDITANGQIVDLVSTQTMSAKTLTSPTLAGTATDTVATWNTSTHALEGFSLIATTGNTALITGSATVAGNPVMAIGGVTLGASGLIFEGAVDNIEGLLAWAPTTADRTIQLPDGDGTLMLTTSSPAAMVIASQATGDLLYASSASAWSRLGIQAAGYVLAGGSTPAWSNAPQITSINLGNASDSTITRVSAGVLAVEGNNLLSAATTMVDSIVWDASGIIADGTQCADPAKATINSGPVQYTIICTDNDASTMYGHVTMPDSWNAGTVTMELSYLQSAADTAALNADVAMQCRGAGEVPSSTWGTEIAIDDTNVTGSNAVDTTTSGAVTPAGTCAAGDNLWWRIQLDATGTTTAVATLHFLGAKLEYTKTLSGD